MTGSEERRQIEAISASWIIQWAQVSQSQNVV
jgi:hypothetical protein